MVRRRLIALMLLPLAFAAVDDAWLPPALAKDGDSGGGGRGGRDDGGGGSDNSGRGGGDNSGRGSGDDRGRGDDRGDEGGHGRGRGGDDGGQGRGRGRGGDDDARAGAQTGSWGSTSSDRAHEAVSQGWALALSTILPTVVKAVPGQVLEVDLRQSWTGEWRYEFLVLTRDRRYQEVVVDARRNQILQIRRR
jgi:hypothetical protein